MLPADAGGTDSILAAEGRYRVDGRWAEVLIREPVAGGHLTVSLLEYEGSFPTRLAWSTKKPYPGAGRLTLDLDKLEIGYDGISWGTVPVPIRGRRFCWDLCLTIAGRTVRRKIGQYIAGRHDHGAAYYQGDTYVDYEGVSAAENTQVLELLTQHGVRGPVLEVGCATGGLIALLASVGIEAYGVDVSDWAIAEAEKRVSAGRVCVCNVEDDELPASIAARAPFRAAVLWAVFEHFRNPFGTLERLSSLMAPDAQLLINTTNADSLSRRLFGADWEGYFDPTHLKVDAVSIETMRAELPRLGWDIVEMSTRTVWDGSADPLHATVREWWATDARFRKLLAEKDLGDFLICVAVKRSKAPRR